MTVNESPVVGQRRGVGDLIRAVGEGGCRRIGERERLQLANRGDVGDRGFLSGRGDDWDARERLGRKADRADGAAGRAGVETGNEIHRRLNAAVEDIVPVEGRAGDGVVQLRRKRCQRPLGCVSERREKLPHRTLAIIRWGLRRPTRRTRQRFDGKIQPHRRVLAATSLAPGHDMPLRPHAGVHGRT